MEKIFLPTIKAMNAEGRTFKGCLYFGLMITPKGPKVVEYNCRFGDPETQVVLPLLESDLFKIMVATADGTLADTEVKFSNKSACCVIYATKGYPEKYEKGLPMTLPDADAFAARTSTVSDALIYVAGAKKAEDGSLLSNGGRVLGITTVADTLKDAVAASYALTKEVKFDGGFYRNDIGARALKALK